MTPSFQVGSYILNYKIQGKLGSGAFGSVYSASLSTNGSIYVYAMKVCSREGQSAQISKNEVSVLRRIEKNDPNGQKNCSLILDEFGFGSFRCLVFPLLGKSLLAFLNHNNKKAFPRAHVQEITRQLLSALEFIHSIGIVHRDVKADNILLRKDEFFLSPLTNSGPRKVLSDIQICLSDFGISRYINDVKQKDILLTPFLDPETCLGIPWDYGVDVYAAGLLMYHLAWGGPFMPPGLDPPTTLAYLHAIQGHIPQHLATHASRATNIPFTIATSDSHLSPRKQKIQMDFVKLGIPKSFFVDVATRHKIKLLPDRGMDFDTLARRLLVYDPTRRPSARDALAHQYFTINFPPPPPL